MTNNSKLFIGIQQITRERERERERERKKEELVRGGWIKSEEKPSPGDTFSFNLHRIFTSIKAIHHFSRLPQPCSH
jgi:hypothetical protein